jgi:polyhydroxybutyrate depolymerase
VWVAILLPFELALLLVPGNPLVHYALLSTLLTPPFMAAFAAAPVRESDPSAHDGYGVTPFIATRPLTSTALVAAKLTMAIWSTLAAWLLVLVAIPLGLTLSGTWPEVIGWARQGVEGVGAARVLAVVLLILAGLVAATWKQLVQGLCIGLTGRAWLVKSSMLLRLSLLIAILPSVEWIFASSVALAGLWEALPWILAALVGFKMAAAAWIATRLYRDRLLSDRALVTGAACWLVVVLAIYGLLAWFFSLPASMPRYPIALVAILAVPLARPSAAPLALAWSRHRGARRDTAAASAITHRRSRGAVAVVLLLIGVPVALALVDAVLHSIAKRANDTIVSSYRGRDYLLYVPQSYDAAEPTPLVISLHGAAASPAQQMNLSRWNRLADNDGFIVAYPAGTGFPRSWQTFDPDEQLEREVGFISGLIDTLQSAYNIDPARIYANGMSNGGGMAFVLSCMLPERIAAVGVVAPAQTLPPGWCANRRPVPVIAFHGDADPIVLYAGGTMGGPFSPVRPVFPAVRDWVARWGRRNRCAPSSVASAVTSDVTRLEYPGCANDAAVVLFTIHGGGHTWPGGEPLPEWFVGRTSRSIDATRQMWAFFQEHPLVRD